MRKVAALVLLLCCFMGCSVNQTFIEGVDDIWSVIGPEYVAYIDGDPSNDPVLDEAQRENRLRAVQILTETLKQMKESESDE